MPPVMWSISNLPQQLPTYVRADAEWSLAGAHKLRKRCHQRIRRMRRCGDESTRACQLSTRGRLALSCLGDGAQAQRSREVILICWWWAAHNSGMSGSYCEFACSFCVRSPCTVRFRTCSLIFSRSLCIVQIHAYGQWHLDLFTAVALFQHDPGWRSLGTAGIQARS